MRCDGVDLMTATSALANSAAGLSTSNAASIRRLGNKISPANRVARRVCWRQLRGAGAVLLASQPSRHRACTGIPAAAMAICREHSMAGQDHDRGEARRLIRRRDHAALATSLEGQPYVSLVAIACDSDASVLLLLSDLAQHTKNLAADPRISLLIADDAGPGEPLASARLSLLGRVERIEDPAAAARFAARQPASRNYAGFADFHLSRVLPERGHLVAGFGRIRWVAGDELRLDADASALAAAESQIVAHMNDDHPDAIALYAERLLLRRGKGWRMTGIDPEGLDLRRPTTGGSEIARLDFVAPVLTPAAARRMLVNLAEQARQAALRE